MTLYDYLDKYNALRFHTPGHMGRLDRRDITEIEGEFPCGLVTAAEARVAGIYKSKFLHFALNGSSGGLKALILAADCDIVSESYRHRCVDEGARLAKRSVFDIIGTDEIRTDGLPALPSADSIIRTFNANLSAGAAIIQYPDYYGRCVNLDEIYNAVKKAGKILLVDSAHGAHFIFRPDLFPASATLLSDGCNLSAHKTLSAYTQTAYLCYNDRMRAMGVHLRLEDLGTTSPNYVLLAQLEKAALDAKTNCRSYDRLKIKLSGLNNLPHLNNDDFTRFVLDCNEFGGGERIFKSLRRSDITAEKYDERYCVFIITPSHTNDDLDTLCSTLKEIISNK